MATKTQAEINQEATEFISAFEKAVLDRDIKPFTPGVLAHYVKLRAALFDRLTIRPDTLVHSF